MNWLLLVIVSAVSFSVASLLQRVLLKEEQSDPIAYGAVFQLLVSILIFFYALIDGFSVPSNILSVLPNLILMTLFYAWFNLTLFKAYQVSEASEVGIILASRTMWSVVTAYFFLGEALPLNRIVGILLVILGVIVVSWKKGSWKFNKGHVFAMLAAFFFGAAFTNDAFLIDHFGDVPSYMVISFALPSLALLIMKPSSIKNLKMFMDIKRLGKMLVTSFLWGVAALTIFLAYQAGGDVIQIQPISQISIIATVILAYFFLKEKKKIWQKIGGAFVVFGGVLLLIL